MPWSNSSSLYPMHYIYRNNVFGNDPNNFILIDSVNVIEDGFQYTDTGEFEDIELDENKIYCYYVIIFCMFYWKVKRTSNISI